MGQGEIIEFLKTIDEPISSRHIAEALNISHILVCNSLSKLLKYKEVQFIELSQEEARKKYNYKVTRRLRFYYL